MGSQNSRIGKSHNRLNRPSNIILPKSQSLSVQSIKSWKDAVELASLAENANRAPLMEVYRSITRDLHLKSDIQTRVLKIMGSKFKIVDAAGKENPEIQKLFKSKWFNRFLYHAMMAKFHGTTVIELWDLDPETMALKATNLIPRENCLFEDGIIVKEVGDEQGYLYKEGIYEPYYIQIGSNNDLGLLEDVAPDALAKKFAKAAWTEFCEKYGIPPRWVTTDSYSDTRHRELAEMMASMVNNHWAVLQGNEKIEVMQTNGANAKAVFDDLIKRMNSEMSKGILGQDGTTNSNDKSGTYGSLKVMQDVADDRHDADKTDIAYLINDELLWRMEMISPLYKGITNYSFEWDESKELSPEDLVETVVKLSSAGYDVDIEYITQQTGIPVTGIRQMIAEATPNEKGEKKKPNSKQSLNAMVSNEIISYYQERKPDDSLNIEAVDLGSYTRLIEKIAKDLHQGKMKPEDLNTDLVKNIYKDLNEAAGQGYGKDYYNYDSNAERKLELRQNLYRFSGAKTYQETAKLNFLLQGEDGEPRSFEDFKKEALKLNDEYNRNYLRTEAQTAQRASAQVEKWAKYEDQKELYPNLQYKTVKDEKVREDHENQHDVIKPVDDDYWNRWYPPNGWGPCRCYVVQTTKPATKGTPKGSPAMGFNNNVGKTGKTFDTEHPYFVFPPDKVKKIREGFESLKLSEPNYEQVYKKGKAKLETSIWADPKNIVQHISTGKILAKDLKAKVQLRPQVDTSILKKEKNATFSINEKTANLKQVKTAKDIQSELKSIKTDTAIFNLDNSKMKALEVVTEVGQNIAKKISSVFFTRKEKALELTREQILKKETGQLENLLKD
ncbi:DUF935 family protein [Gramella lutea]|uniref:DUF935 family protein n=1 Tax=Christiangramia lutea TaxID=1607951 RepID=A0A9X1V5M3_9FLAO|nr:DUF935 family protein [Christiangramia lutea]MCH4824285.1 DUF935 family protein [Christiangramia lutea]